VTLEWSHGKRRPTTPRPNGHDGGAPALPPAPEESAPERDATTGRFLPGNRGYRRRMVKAKAKGITTLDPSRVDAWLAPFVKDGAAYGVELMRRVQGDPALLRLAGDVADAHTVYRALLALAAKGDTEALRESRAWLREHRSALATLSSLADESKDVERPKGDEHLYVDVDAEGTK
jgi:hypothetical protein